MDELQEDFERKVGDAFIAWLNTKTAYQYQYIERPETAPDLIYKDKDSRLLVEVSSAFYDGKDADYWWGALRGDPRAPKSWSGRHMDKALMSEINRILRDKCGKAYGPNCVLVLFVHPSMTTVSDIEEMKGEIAMPSRNPFKAIYLTGFFPISSAGSAGGYHCWCLSS